MKNYLKELFADIKSAYSKEPSRVNAFLAAAVVFAFAKAGVVIPETDVLTAVAYGVPFLLGGELTRQKVVPVVKIGNRPPSQLP